MSTILFPRHPSRFSLAVVIALALAAAAGRFAGAQARADRPILAQESSPGASGDAGEPKGSDDQKPPPLPERATVPLDGLDPNLPKPISAKPPKLPPQAAAALKAAETYLERKNYPRAIDRLERAIGFDRDHFVLRRKLGIAYARLPNWGKAMDNLQQAVKTNSDDLEAHLIIANVAASQRDRELAIRSYRMALRCTGADPNNPRAASSLLKLAGLLEEEGYWTAAEQAYARLSRWLVEHASVHSANDELRPYVREPERLLRRRAELLARTRRYAQAADMLRRVYRRDRSDQDAAARLIRYLQQAGEYQQAEAFLADLLREAEPAPFVAPLAQAVCQASNDPNMPLRLWHRSDPAQASAEVGITLAKAAMEMDNPSDARKILRRLLDRQIAQPRPAGMLLELYLREGIRSEAMELLARLLDSDAAESPQVVSAVDRLARSVGHEEARTIARRALQEDANQSASRTYLAGRIADGQGLDELAGQCFRAAIEAREDFFPAYAPLAEAYLDAGDSARLDRLTARLEKLAADSDQATAMQVLGGIRLRRGDVAGAIAALKTALERRRDHVPTLLLLARAMRRAEGTSSQMAEQALLRALRLAPNSQRVHRRLMEFYFDARRTREAITVAERAVRELADPVAGRVMLAEASLAAGRVEDAQRLLAELDAAAPNHPRAMLLRIRLGLREITGMPTRETFERFEGRLRTLLRAEPGLTDAHRDLAALYSQVGLDARAVEHWRRVLRADPADRRAALAYAASLVRLERYADAAHAAMELLRADGESLTARQLAIESLDRAGEHAKAVELLDEWLARVEEDDSPLAGWYRLNRWEQLEKAGLYDKLHESLDLRASQEGANRGLIDSLKLSAFVADGKPRQAAAYARRRVEEMRAGIESGQGGDELPTRLRLTQLRAAIVLADANAHDQADDLLNTWIAGRTDPTVEHLRGQRILLLGDAGKLDAARQAARAWIDQSPAALTPRQMLVSTLSDANRVEESIELLERWQRQLKDDADLPVDENAAARQITRLWVRQTIISAYLEARKPDKAIQAANALLEEHPDQYAAMRLKASALGELGRSDEQIALMEKLYAANREDPSINNDLGYTYADRGIKLQQARAMTALAVSSNPDVIAFRDSLGWALYKLGKLGEAGEVFEEILLDQQLPQESAEARAVIIDHAGDVFWRLGWTDKAVSLWKRALAAAMELPRKRLTQEIRSVIIQAEAKIVAVEKGDPPRLAPLGTDAADEDPDAQHDARDQPQPAQAPGGIIHNLEVRQKQPKPGPAPAP
jgi:tetratricopeptide (TPR) repeat protein